MRQAIWEAYDGICFYSKIPVTISEMQLDHVIPRHLLKNKEECHSVFKRFNLSETFEIDSLLNIVPCSLVQNKMKGVGLREDTNNILIYVKSKWNKIERNY